MARLIWSPRSLQDLDDICEYIARDSEQAARAVARRVNEFVERIPDHAEAGNMPPTERWRPFIETRVNSSLRSTNPIGSVEDKLSESRRARTAVQGRLRDVRP